MVASWLLFTLNSLGLLVFSHFRFSWIQISDNESSKTGQGEKPFPTTKKEKRWT